MFEQKYKPSGETDEQYRKRHNAQLAKRQLEDDKRREEEMTRRRAEWTATPESERLCTQCGLRLDSVTIAKILENPMTNRPEHPFCNSIEIEADVVRGLVGLLGETYEGKDIPLESLKQVIEVWRRQKGFCDVSKIKLAFPAPETEEKPVIEARPSYQYQSALSSFDNAILQRQTEREEAQRKRHSELHSPVLDWSGDGKLRLISKTVASWKSELSDEEFRGLIHTLAEEFKTLPTSRSYHPVSAVGSLTYRQIR